MGDDVGNDLGAMYRAARERIAVMVSDAVGDVPVPATPLWTVHDVVAHLAGVVEDAVTGNLDGVATDPWTAAQVERGRAKPIAQLLAEWDASAPLIEGFLSSSPGEQSWRAVLDIHTHENDLRHALHAPSHLPAGVAEWIRPMLVEQFAETVAAAGLAPVSVNASTFELLRARLGRRTTDEVCAYGWSADPDPYLESFFIFGRREESLGESEPVTTAVAGP